MQRIVLVVKAEDIEEVQSILSDVGIGKDLCDHYEDTAEQLFLVTINAVSK